MKTIIRSCGFKRITALAVLSVGVAHGQNTLQFTGVKATVENAVLLYWASNTNEIYEVDYADQLAGNPDGTTSWTPLYQDYPSHGTNSFVADCGNYDLIPSITHPKNSPMRFYRVLLTGSNSGDSPTVAITSPGNNATASGSLTVTVNASSTQMLVDTRLFVDGEEQYATDDGTNFLVNTCEWPNGPHVLFAVARSQSGLPGLPEDTSVTYGSSVSPYVTVNFSNLITRFDFSQAFFEPELGETQRVTAAFAANVNWTVQVQDVNSNTVRTASGSGSSMAWDFDGNDSSGHPLAPAIYSYLLTVQTNGQALSADVPPSGDGGGSPPTPSMSTSTDALFPTSAKQAIAAGLDYYYVQSPPMPPVYTNGQWLAWEDVYGPVAPIKVDISDPTRQRLLQSLFGSTSLAANTMAGYSPDTPSPAGYSGPASQATRGPTRKPKMGHISKVGTYGIAYQTYPGGLNCNPPLTGWPRPLQVYVKIDGQPVGTRFNASARPEFGYISTLFQQYMRNSGYKASFVKSGTNWSISDISGSGGIFNSVNLGVLIVHGSYGETTDSASVLNTYLWHEGGTYARLRDLVLGSPGTNGLRWMTLFTCSALRPANVNNMIQTGWMGNIISQDLHLLSATESTIYETPRTGWNYATNLVAEQTLPEAWFGALRSSLAIATPAPPSNVVARVMGWQPCFSDSLHYYNDPDTSQGLFSQSRQVYP